MYASLVTLLSGNTAAGTRVHPLTAPDSEGRPYITYQRITAVDNTPLSGGAAFFNTRMQIDVYADTYIAADSIASQVKTLLAGWSVKNVQISDVDLYENEVKLFRVQLDYSIWHP